VTTPAAYVQAILGPREPVLDTILRDSLLGHGLRPMQVDDNAARVLQLLTMIHQPRRVIEVGTFFGYSAIHIARGLPESGRLTTLEIDAELAELARRNLAAAGVADRVDVIAGPAADHLGRVEPKSVDMIFIDADKAAYPEYLKQCYPLLRPGGLLIADDAFAHGDFSAEGADATTAINTYNRAISRSPNLFSAFIGTNNGFLVSCKR
jgi:predicted O-methyltransferase YrrM